MILPEDHDEAVALRQQHLNRFWCTRQAGGCGAALLLKAGRIRRPYFSHAPGDRRGCAFTTHPHEAGRGYEHLILQQALRDWLQRQGLRVQLEKLFDDRDRADLHVIVHGIEHSIEVQLTPIDAASWERRDTRYRAHVKTVTWLFGPAAERLRSDAIARDGWALLVRRDKKDQRQVLLGTANQHREAWSLLDACRFTEDGLDVPELASIQREGHEIRDGHAKRLQAEADLARERLASRLAKRKAASTRKGRPAPAGETPATHPQPSWLDELPGLTLPEAPASKRSVAWWSELFPSSGIWQEQQDWSWLAELPDRLAPPAKVLAYLCRQLYYSGPIDLLALSDLNDDDIDTIVSQMNQAGLITIKPTAQGVKRWSRYLDASHPFPSSSDDTSTESP